MSHIFDALQRSETERAGAETLMPAVATELLERTERDAVAKWDAEKVLIKADDVVKSASGHSFGQPGVTSAAAAVDPATGRGLASGTPGEVFSQFRELEMLVPANSRLVALSAPETPAAEAFRLLGVRFRHLRTERAIKKVLVTSTTPEEGKSTIAGNLACTMARAEGQRTLLIDGDLRRPALSKTFGLSDAHGLCEYLRGESRITESIYHLSRPGIWVLPAGAIPANPLELMQSKKLATLLQQLNTWFDWIIIDSPPVVPLADTSIWARLADGTLLVTRTGHTKKGHLQKGLEVLDPNKLIGALLNSSTESDPSDYSYYK